jgi:hypothetical protein
MHRVTVCLLLIAGMASAGSANAQAQVQPLRGEILKINGRQLEVRSSEGSTVLIRLADDLRLSARSAAEASMLAPGTFVGTTAIAQADGTLLAREMHVFPESMRGRGEGHRSTQGEPGSTMTNATVAAVGAPGPAARSTMTNATVAEVAGAPGARTMTLRYKDGEQVVVVPEDVPVVMVEPAERSLLVPGAYVVVYAEPQPDGTLAAARITVGKNGFVPPL